MLTDWRRERFIRKTLRKVGRQRVAAILAGGVWLIERAVVDDDRTAEALRTCHMRGWVEVLQDSVRAHTVTDVDRPAWRYEGQKPLYRLTDSGWNAIHRTHGWIVSTWFIAAVTLVVTVFQGVVSQRAAAMLQYVFGAR